MQAVVGPHLDRAIDLTKAFEQQHPGKFKLKRVKIRLDHLVPAAILNVSVKLEDGTLITFEVQYNVNPK